MRLAGQRLSAQRLHRAVVPLGPHGVQPSALLPGKPPPLPRGPLGSWPRSLLSQQGRGRPRWTLCSALLTPPRVRPLAFLRGRGPALTVVRVPALNGVVSLVTPCPFPVLGHGARALQRGCQALRRAHLFSGALSRWPWLVLGGGVTGLPAVPWSCATRDFLRAAGASMSVALSSGGRAGGVSGWPLVGRAWPPPC